MRGGDVFAVSGMICVCGITFLLGMFKFEFSFMLDLNLLVPLLGMVLYWAVIAVDYGLPLTGRFNKPTLIVASDISRFKVMMWFVEYRFVDEPIST